MPLPPPLLEFWLARSALGASMRRTPWGTVVTDPRYPHLFDANHAGVFERHEAVSAEEIRAALHPALRAARVPYEHVEVWGPGSRCPALDELRRDAEREVEDAVMVLEGPPEVEAPPEVDVRELDEPDDETLTAYEETRQLFGGLLDPATVEQMRRREREVEGPAGLRTFGAFLEGRIAGFANLLSLERVGYIDTVVTLPPYRRRGVATALVNRLGRESVEAGDRAVHLLADAGGAPQRLYERLGFRVRASVRSTTRRLDPSAPPLE